MSNLKEERKVFENWQKSMSSNIARWTKHGDYVSERTNSEWFAWKKRAELAEVEIKKSFEKLKSSNFDEVVFRDIMKKLGESDGEQ